MFKYGENQIFHFSKDKGILFGKTYDMDNVEDEQIERNPFLCPDYIIITFT